MTSADSKTANTGVFMTTRMFASVAVAGMLCAVLFCETGFAQQRPYKAPRTADGQPDLQGFWSNTTYTPLQRPNGVTKPYFTKEEAEEIIKKAAVDEGEQTVPGTIADVHYDFTQ